MKISLILVIIFLSTAAQAQDNSADMPFFERILNFFHHTKNTVDATLTPVTPDCAQPSPSPVPILDPEFDILWDKYVADTTKDPLQKGCEPTRKSPPAGVQRRGVIVLYHGLTACPQQWFEWADQLAAQGFEVLMPLLPGHGRPVQPGNHDDVSELPDLKTWQAYNDIAKRMNEIVGHSQGIRVVGGESLGGAIAMRATEDAPGLYTRQIEFAPFYKAEDRAMFSVVKLFRYEPLLKEFKVPFGLDCIHERALGRAGYCGYLVKQVAAAEVFGLDTLDKVKPGQTQTQFVGVYQDPVSAGKSIQSAYTKLLPGGNVSGCLMQPASDCTGSCAHSLISRYDSPDKNKYWISDLLKASTQFVTDGIPLQTEGKDPKWLGKCDVGSVLPSGTPDPNVSGKPANSSQDSGDLD